jgi:hypothetical protein
MIRRPKLVDLESSIDDFESHYEKQSGILAPRVKNTQEAKIGISFFEQTLVDKTDEKTRNKKKLEQWEKMVTFGLDSEYSNKVYTAGEDIGKFSFTSYALVGLKNFYNKNAQKFRDELSNGPPAEYRWLAWYFVSC